MMTVERWQQVKELFHSALEREARERASFLAEACAGDERLREEVESLIASHELKGSFLNAPAYEVAAALLTDETREPLEGKLIGHYRILRLLGRGGMGEIYLAEDEKLKRMAALKLLPAEFTEDANRLARFQREARAASALNHPNILTIYEIGEAEGTHFIATEYIEGDTLRYSMSASLTLRAVLDVAIQVASALAAAHEAGIIHRDIKPDNIMVRRDGYVKVLDFGLAKLMEQPDETVPKGAGLSNTHPGVVMGTVSYMSPEQARGLAVDARTDIWSLGCVIYECITGRAPFDGPTMTDVLAAILEREPPPLGASIAGAPSELEWITRKALRKDRDERYQTARELLGDLRSLKEQLEFEIKLEASVPPEARNKSVSASLSAGPAAELRAGERDWRTKAVDAVTTAKSFEAPPGSTKRRRTWLFATLALITLGTLLAAGLGTYQFLRLKKQTRPFDRIEVTQLTTSRNLIHAAISPDGKYIAYVVSDREQHSLWLRQVSAANDTLIVPAAPLGYWGVTFSRDGSALYYVTRDESGVGSLYRVPALGGTPRKLLSGLDSPVTFSPDGRRMAFVRGSYPQPDESAIVVADAEGKSEQALAVRRRPGRFYPAYFTGPSWSPDGELIASSATNGGGDQIFGSDLYVYRLSDGAEQRLTSQNFTLMGRVEWLKDMSGLVMVASDQFTPSLPGQIWFAAYPGGETRRITNDLNDYRALSVAADSSRLVTVSVNDVSSIWVAPEGDAARAQAVAPVRSRGGIAWTKDGRVVYATETSGTWDIWIMNQDGTGRRQLTNGTGHNIDPAVSPDGRSIAFVYARSGKVGLSRMGIDGSNPTQLTEDVFAYHPTFSSDGRWIIYAVSPRGGAVRGWKSPPKLWKIPAEGGQPVPVSDKFVYRPSVSPDGRWIACFYNEETGAQDERYDKIAIIPFEGGEPVRTYESAGNMTTRDVLHWTPDGRALLYNVMSGNVSNIWKQPLEGGPPVRITDFKDSLINDFDWSPGGALVCTRSTLIRDIIMITDVK